MSDDVVSFEGACNLKRNINIDMVKVVASLCVVCVHFFLNSGFYDTELHGFSGLGATFLRTLFMVCVPLFLISTGYIMLNKQISKKYYVGVLRTLTIYIVASLICLIWRIVYFGQDIGLQTGILMILDYSACSYSWYIEMYLGLFLLIPFLNVLYASLNVTSRKILLLSLLILVALPPQINYAKQIIPGWWSDLLFPVLYYYIGAYLRDYPLQFSRAKLGAMTILWIGICSSFNYYLCINSEGNVFGWHDYTDWGSIQNVVSASLLFVFILKLNLPSSSSLTGRFISLVSRCSLGTYLLSWILDKTLYPLLTSTVGTFSTLFQYFCVVVLPIYIGAFLLSIIATSISEIISEMLELKLIRILKC